VANRASTLNVGAVEVPVWGTFSVRDHCRPEAFLREVLIFDRLLVPYPDPGVPGEWERWRHPNPDKPYATWNPGRLDQLLGVLGTQAEPGHHGAQLVQQSLWSPFTWTQIQSKLEMAEMATGDPWMDTRLGLGIREGGTRDRRVGRGIPIRIRLAQGGQA
jgi:hypothetical protein